MKRSLLVIAIVSMLVLAACSSLRSAATQAPAAPPYAVNSPVLGRRCSGCPRNRSRNPAILQRLLAKIRQVSSRIIQPRVPTASSFKPQI